MQLSLNGRWIKHIQLTGTEPEFNFGYGVFETIRSYYEQPFELPAHLHRLRQSARALHFKITTNDAQLTNWVQKHCTGKAARRIKLIAAPQRIYILSQPLRVPSTIYTTGVTMSTYHSDRPDPTVKSLARIHEYRAHTDAVTRGYYDALLLDPRQRIFEGAYSNIFMIKCGVLYTPDKNILFGVTRGLILKLVQRHYPVRFRPLTLPQVQSADECFLTQTSVGIAPVVRVDRHTIARGHVGPITQDLIKRFNDYVEAHYSTRRHS